MPLHLPGVIARLVFVDDALGGQTIHAGLRTRKHRSSLCMLFGLQHLLYQGAHPAAMNAVTHPDPRILTRPLGG